MTDVETRKWAVEKAIKIQKHPNSAINKKALKALANELIEELTDSKRRVTKQGR